MDFSYDKKVGNRIREIREKQKLTQDQLVAKLGIYGLDITRSALAKIEVGMRHIYVDEIKALKTVLKVPYEDLFV